MHITATYIGFYPAIQLISIKAAHIDIWQDVSFYDSYQVPFAYSINLFSLQFTTKCYVIHKSFL